MSLRPRDENSGMVIRASFTFTHPRAVILTNPTVLIAFGLFILSVVFTIWPNALEHAPISFERRGVVHHIWHYSLLGGSMLALYGMFTVGRYRLQYEFFGLLLLVNAMAMNLVAQLSLYIESGTASVTDGVTGIGLGQRFIVIGILLLRMYVLYFEPKVDWPVTNILVEKKEPDDE